MARHFEVQLQKLTYHVATSLDGFIASEDDSFAAFPMEGDHVDAYRDHLRSYSSVVMGKVTYGIGLSMGVLDPYPWLETHVFSKTLSVPDLPKNVTLHAGDPVAVVRALKEQRGNGVYLAGGGRLAATLFRAGLVDALWLKLNPIVLGRGKPLFGPDGPGDVALAHEETVTYRTGVLLVKYAVSCRS